MFVLSGKGNSSKPAALIEQIKAGAAVLKVHEDWGSTTAANDRQPAIEVDPETYRVTVDGELATIEPAQTVALNQLFYLI